MALSFAAPQSIPDDMMPIKAIVALLQDTGYPASETTIRRWITDLDLQTIRSGRKDLVSYTDILIAQRDAAHRAGI
jgi:hypothetical protein